jgi:integrase/recombinase XerD
LKSARFKPFLFPKPYSDGRHPVFIRIYHNGKSSYVSTGHAVPYGAWNPEKSELWTKKANITWNLLESMSKEDLKKFRDKQASIIVLPNAERINNHLRHKVEELEVLQKNFISNQQEIDVKILKDHITGKRSEEGMNFIAYVEEIIKRKYNEKKIRTSEKYRVLLGKLNEISKDNPLPFRILTVDFLNDFNSFLEKKGFHHNYIHNVLKSLRSIIQSEAIVKDRLLPPEKNPFIFFSMPRLLPTVNVKLDLQEIRKIENLELEKNQLIFHVRNSFIFSFYCAGIGISDLLQLRWINITDYGRLNYYPGQSGNERSIKLLKEAWELLRLYRKNSGKVTDYIFPFLKNNSLFSGLLKPEDFRQATPEILTDLSRELKVQIAVFNRKLKEIALIAGITKRITSSTARHSFAGIAVKKISVYEIQKIIGHSGYRVTELYLQSLDTEALDKAMEKVFR